MKKYNKHYLKKSPSSGQVLIEDDQPVLGDIAKADCPLEDWHVKTLNKSWKKSGVYFKEVEQKEIETKKAGRPAKQKEE